MAEQERSRTGDRDIPGPKLGQATETEPGKRAPARAEIVAAAQQERHDLMAAETARHLNNIECELRRHAEALAHYEHVFRLRTGEPEPAEAAVRYGR